MQDNFMKVTPTLDQFMLQEQPRTDSGLREVFQVLESVSKTVSDHINKAGLLNILGASDTTNIQGENQQKLDLIANEYFKSAFAECKSVSAFASEEEDSFIVFDNNKDDENTFVIAIDPIDGSSNIDYAIPVGTIFSIFQKKTDKQVSANIEDFLCAGVEQVAAGYILYGSSTIFVYTCGHGVNGFTLDSSKNEYFLSHPNIKFPEQGKIYSVNEANFVSFSQTIKNYIDAVKHQKDYSARYIGSLVADFHRNLLKGGIYLYPATDAQSKGKLRLLYECSPLAFIAEQAGGQATDGQQRILDIAPTELHQRSPLFIGNADMLKELNTFL